MMMGVRKKKLAEMEYAMLGKPDKKPHAIFMMYGLWARG